MDKKSEVITIRITSETKHRLEELAAEKEWSLAQTANKILASYFEREDPTTQEHTMPPK